MTMHAIPRRWHRTEADPLRHRPGNRVERIAWCETLMVGTILGILIEPSRQTSNGPVPHNLGSVGWQRLRPSHRSRSPGKRTARFERQSVTMLDDNGAPIR